MLSETCTRIVKHNLSWCAARAPLVCDRELNNAHELKIVTDFCPLSIFLHCKFLKKEMTQCK
jgi:hypothetical protein